MDSGDDWETFVYEQAHADAYVMSTQWIDFMLQEEDVTSKAFRKGNDIMNISPILGGD